MTEIKLFSTGSTVKERVSSEAVLERDLQSLIEKNMELFFGVRFLKSEYAITNGSQNENVISQGLFYLDWLLDHKADFKLLVMEKLGMQAAQTIDWSVPCVICIARDFTRYDIHAVNQMQRNIKLVSYRKYDDDLILFEHLNAPNVKSLVENGLLDGAKGGAQKSSGEKTHVEKLALASESIKTLYHSICDFIESLGDDIAPNQLKLYLAYKKVQNMVCIELHNKQVVLFIKISPDTVSLEDGFTRDMRGVGHYGTGDLQVIIKNAADFEKAKPLLERAYREG